MGNRLRELRESKGLSQTQLAIKLYVSKECISHYENETRHPSYDYLKRCAEFFDVSLDFLLAVRKEKTDDINTAILIKVLRNIGARDFTDAELNEYAEVMKKTAAEILGRRGDKQ